MKIAGIILIVIQIIATVGGIIGAVAGGTNPFAGGFWGLLGYFAFGIIGVILLIIHHNRKNKK